jgi:hypothetical protein
MTSRDRVSVLVLLAGCVAFIAVLVAAFVLSWMW